MEKKMNLISMFFLFFCVVGFDHFYKSVMSIPEESSQEASIDPAPLIPPNIQSPKIAKVYQRSNAH